MSNSNSRPASTDAIDAAAALWVLRRDRGLSPSEQDEFSQWLAADSRHGEALALHRWGWDELDRLIGLQTAVGALPNPDLLAPPTSRRAFWRNRGRWIAPLVFAAAAAMVFGVMEIRRGDAGRTPSPIAAALAAPCERQTLDDGSIVDLNRGAAIEVAFTPGERHVRLLRGEANFTVAKDHARPFIVSAGGVDVRAVGTIFNVRLDQVEVEVVVAEGSVQVAGFAVQAGQTVGQMATDGAAEPLVVETGHQAVVPRTPTPPLQLMKLTPAQVDARLAWQPRLLDFNSKPLAEIVAEFNQRNPMQLKLGDPALESLRLSVTFRSDNVEAFVRLMESDFGCRATWHGDTEIILTKAR